MTRFTVENPLKSQTSVDKQPVEAERDISKPRKEDEIFLSRKTPLGGTPDRERELLRVIRHAVVGGSTVELRVLRAIGLAPLSPLSSRGPAKPS